MSQIIMEVWHGISIAEEFDEVLDIINNEMQEIEEAGHEEEMANAGDDWWGGYLVVQDLNGRDGYLILTTKNSGKIVMQKGLLWWCLF